MPATIAELEKKVTAARDVMRRMGLRWQYGEGPSKPTNEQMWAAIEAWKAAKAELEKAQS